MSDTARRVVLDLVDAGANDGGGRFFRKPAWAGGWSNVPKVNLGPETFDHASNVLVAQHSEYRVRRRKETLAVEVLRKNGRRVRVMRNVENHDRPARQDLKTRGQGHASQAFTHGLLRNRQAFRERLESSQRTRRIEQLIRSAQRGKRQAGPPLGGAPVTPLLRTALGPKRLIVKVAAEL